MGKKIRLPLLSVVVVCSVFSASFFSNTSDHYQLDLKKTSIDRPPLDQYIYHWLEDREEKIENYKTKFPIIMVSAEGGGSRAGLWSFLIHSYLYEKSNGGYFKENLLSLTGASGGSVGNAMFFAEAQYASQNRIVTNFSMSKNTNYFDLKYKASAIYKENYLSIGLMSLLGRDLFKEITGIFDFKNRGQLLEEQWVRGHKEYFYDTNNQSVLDIEFLSLYKEVYKNDKFNNEYRTPPLLCINTTHTQTGNYNIISPVSYHKVRSLAGMDDFLENLQSSYPDTSIALSTAMRINASFPFITPVGEIKKIQETDKIGSDQYADAGYYDNIGSRVSKGIEEVLHEVILDSFPNLQEKIEIRHLIITNEKNLNVGKRETQLTAPLTTLSNVREGHTKEIKEQLGDEYEMKLKPTKIKTISKSVLLRNNLGSEELMIRPVLPLGRYLSTIAIRSMEARLDSISKELDLILE